MNAYVHVVPIISLWVLGCWSVPRPQYQVSNSSSSAVLGIQRSRPLSGSVGGWSVNTNNRDRMRGNSGGIVFPTDPPDTDLSAKISITPPPQVEPKKCPRNEKFCETIDYPKDYLDILVKKSSGEYRALFGSDILEDEDDDASLAQRINNNDESGLCRSREELYYPQKGEDINGVFRFIINHGNFTQGIRMERCVNEGMACDYSEFFPTGNSAYCKQRYVYRNLAALNENNEVKSIPFSVPSCCMCIVRSLKKEYETPSKR